MASSTVENPAQVFSYQLNFVQVFPGIKFKCSITLCFHLIADNHSQETLANFNKEILHPDFERWRSTPSINKTIDLSTQAC
jgi:hypothetical protein